MKHEKPPFERPDENQVFPSFSHLFLPERETGRTDRFLTFLSGSQSFSEPPRGDRDRCDPAKSAGSHHIILIHGSQCDPECDGEASIQRAWRAFRAILRIFGLLRWQRAARTWLPEARHVWRAHWVPEVQGTTGGHLHIALAGRTHHSQDIPLEGWNARASTSGSRRRSSCSRRRSSCKGRSPNRDIGDKIELSRGHARVQRARPSAKLDSQYRGAAHES